MRAPMRRMLPNWIKIVLAAFGVLFVLGAIFGPSPKEESAAPSAASTTATPTATTSSAPPGRYLVTEIVDAGTVRVTGPLGVSLVRISGLRTPPANGTGCFGAESAAWARNALMNQYVTLDIDSADSAVASLKLTDGSDYSLLAVQAGYARFATTGTVFDTARKAAEGAAETAKRGLWAPPCLGTIDTPPAPSPSSVAPPAPPVERTVAPPPTPKAAPPPEPTTEAPPASSGGGSAYYKNCDAARAANAAPLHVGEPGYRPALDRDHDGTACE
ncbi:thermonuclease family protein [Amycolatopsis minnesotensis]|uniref:thermonuclease family protein n=1 Tax=Amycolatopsis minnesotensis TaxID=337894 RepID=UPI0031DFDEAA